jgi:hypothetical protein
MSRAKPTPNKNNNGTKGANGSHQEKKLCIDEMIHYLPKNIYYLAVFGRVFLPS